MLTPQAFRQRLSVEFKTKRDIYSGEVVSNFIEDLINSTDIRRSEIIVLTYYKVGFVSLYILSKSAFFPSDVLHAIDFWFEPKEVDVNA